MTRESRAAIAPDEETSSGGGRTWLWMLVLFAIVVAGLIFAFGLFYVQPGYWGIKTVRISLLRQEGIRDDPYNVGYHVRIPWMEDFYRLPRGIQVMQFNNEPGRSTARLQFQPALVFKLSGKNEVTVDISVLYKIVDPAAVAAKVRVAPAPAGEQGVWFDYASYVANAAQKAVRMSLGGFSSETFYGDPLLRHRRLEDQADNDLYSAVEIMNDDLRDFGIRVDHVLLRGFRYREAIEEAIEGKVISQQEAVTNRARAAVLRLEQDLKRLQGVGQQQRAQAEAEAQRYVVTRLAAAEGERRSLEAEGNLTLGTATAEKTAAKRSAMQTAGAANQVTLEMAKVLEGVEVIVLPVGGDGGVNLLDIDSALQLLTPRDGQ